MSGRLVKIAVFELVIIDVLNSTLTGDILANKCLIGTISGFIRLSRVD